MDETGPRRIVINGKSYESVEDMPPELRDVYERAVRMLGDADGNGVPDVFEGKGPGMWQIAKQVWSLGRDANRAGIRSVELPESLAGALRPGAADEPPRTSVETRTFETRTVFSSPSLPQGPTEIGGGNLRKVILAVVAATIFALVLQQLGWIE